MAYTALYRKYRPDTFDEVKGQDHVVVTLRNQILSDRVAHAYLFCGTRGTGKTSVAKVFARAVNCESPVNGNPCGHCSVCQGIADGTVLNVIEIDAASNNSVDDVRRIREEVQYSPTQGRRKVYIIDEVHMLSNSAFNALLKTLEEPPSYVMFILATTEVHKVPVTILSRCQRFDFHRISQEVITQQLAQLFAREGIEADEKALRYIARKADGGMRDALSLADQCVAYQNGERLTYGQVLEILGAVDAQVLGVLVGRILEGDIQDLFTQLEELIFTGRDILQLCNDLTGFLRDLLLLRTTQGAGEMVDASEENLAMMRSLAAAMDETQLVRWIRVFSELSSSMRYAVNRRILFEVALIRLCRPQMETDVESLQERVRQLEQIAAGGALAAAAAGNTAGAAAAGGGNGVFPGLTANEETAGVRVYHKAAPADLQMIRDQWSSLMEPLRDERLLYNTLLTASLRFDTADEKEDLLYVVVGGAMSWKYDKDSGVQERLEQIIEDRIGKAIHVRIIKEDTAREMGGRLKAMDVQKRAQEHIGIPIEIVPDGDM